MDNNINLDAKTKAFRFRPDVNDITYIAYLFNHTGDLPQTIIDKIISAYNSTEKKFSEVEVSLHEFYKCSRINETATADIDMTLKNIYMRYKNK